MSSQDTIRVALRTPDAESRAQLLRALATDGALDVTDENDPRRDITIVHAALLLDTRTPQSTFPDDARTVVVYAPDDPALLAQFLIAGIRGYHCAGESWSKLRDVLHRVYAGEIRSDPLTMNELLQMYLQLRQQATMKLADDHHH